MFTSRLPKSTSVRRPSGPNDGSTSFVYSNIPVSVRKANLFTPQPERSLQSSLASTARKSYMTTEKKYQRTSKPMPDHDEQMKMYKSLVDFIKTNAPTFTLPEAKRFFASGVSSSEASRIFEFLICNIYPEFKINKLEIDVPEVLAKLGYPYIKSVTKSALVSITTRQAIVNLLLIFNWLINFIKETDKREELNNKNLDSADRASIKRLQSLMIDPETKHGEMWLREAFNELHPSDGFVDNLNEELLKINEEIERLENDLNTFEESENLLESKKEDLDKWKIYVKEMNAYIKRKQDDALRLKQESCRLESLIEETKRTLDSLGPDASIVVDEQEFMKTKALTLNEIGSIEKTIVRYKQDLETNFDEQLEHEDQQIEKIKELFFQDKMKLEEEKRNKSEKLREERAKDAEKVVLERDFFESLMNNYQQQAISIVEKEEYETEQWAMIEQQLKDNNKIAKKAIKMLRG